MILTPTRAARHSTTEHVDAKGKAAGTVLSRDDIVEIAAENARLKRLTERVVDAAAGGDIDDVRGELQDAGYDFDDDE